MLPPLEARQQCSGQSGDPPPHPITNRGKYFFTKDKRLEPYLESGYEVALLDFNGFGESERIDFYYWRDMEAVDQRLWRGGPARTATSSSTGSALVLSTCRRTT